VSWFASRSKGGLSWGDFVWEFSGVGWGNLGRGSPPRGSGNICLVIFKLIASGWGRDASPVGGCYVMSLGVVNFATPWGAPGCVVRTL
jgi:hypothetical protein